MKPIESNTVNLITKKLDDACFIDFGTRVVQKKDGGNIYPVYGGGGATFKMDTYNRENCLVVSRFAMSKQCTRFVEGKFYLNDSGLTVRPKNEKELAQEYLDYLLLTLNDTIYSLSRGTAQRNLNVSKFRNLIINYPDSKELQLHIANLLSKAENLIAQRKESIRLLDEFLKSTFLEMFGSMNEKNFPLERLDDVSSKINDGEHGSVEKTESGVLYLMARNITHNNTMDFKEISYVSKEAHDKMYKRCNPEAGDILIVCVGATIGKVAIVPKMEEFSIARSVALVKPNYKHVNSQYLLGFFNSEYAKRQIKKSSLAAAQAGLYIGKIKEIKIPVPPIELQTQFAQIVEKTEALKTQYQQSLQELENLYGSLSQKAFRGELSVKQEAVQ
ncbi:MAG: restriction endonuclease subunit S [Cyclobacteriaceae bacterium]|jgi:type I restriction enzyme S subunit|nr:restriction endonuclease subunit S [Cytophagales bacterium]MCZ8327691.1 restriction endonuclease subunit S [Cyclobacteriaceae bacterium]